MATLISILIYQSLIFIYDAYLRLIAAVNPYPNSMINVVLLSMFTVLISIPFLHYPIIILSLFKILYHDVIRSAISLNEVKIIKFRYYTEIFI